VQFLLFHYHCYSILQELADRTGVPPTHLASDYTLSSIASLRPGTVGQLKTCGGCSDTFVRQHGEVRAE